MDAHKKSASWLLMNWVKNNAWRRRKKERKKERREKVFVNNGQLRL